MRIFFSGGKSNLETQQWKYNSFDCLFCQKFHDLTAQFWETSLVHKEKIGSLSLHLAQAENQKGIKFWKNKLGNKYSLSQK